VLDEITRIASTTRLAAQPLLEGRQRAGPAGELDGGSPDCRGDVNVRHPPPPQNQKPTENDEQNEEEVNAYYDICEDGG